MRANHPTISLLELKRLLVDLLEQQPGISIRYRLLGNTWYHNFVTLVQADEDGIALRDEVAEKTILIPDVSSIIQFELDTSFQSFEANVHYEVMIRRQFILF